MEMFIYIVNSKMMTTVNMILMGGVCELIVSIDKIQGIAFRRYCQEQNRHLGEYRRGLPVISQDRLVGFDNSHEHSWSY